MKIHKNSRMRAGFTLIELSISVLIISLMIAGIISIESQNERVVQRRELAIKLDAIGAALYNYRLVNNKLPCPGNASLAKTSANFGLQADGAAEACASGATISSNINLSDGGVSVVGGSVPVRTLGLPDDMAFDPWGNLFTYYLDKEANNTANFTGEYGTAGFTDTNLLNVQDESGATLSESVLAVVLSHGPNGHGAFNVAGNRVNASSSNAAEQENCMCDSSAVAASDTSLLIRIQRTLPTSSVDFTTNFDDVGRFYNKAFFYTYAEKTR
ncbi:MAG: type II secretion system protein [Alphaproteobacteria bacterium]|nr:type II secretion system protein [Alphaproteobacteria bacterium]